MPGAVELVGVALLLAAAMLAALEVFWRGRDHRLSIVDDPDLWAWHRGRVDASPDTVVLIGDSRMQLGFASRESLPAVPGPAAGEPGGGRQGPDGHAGDLAEDEAFRGTVICLRDHPRLACFDCPGTSHLDRRDAPAFTRALLQVLVEVGVLRGEPPTTTLMAEEKAALPLAAVLDRDRITAADDSLVPALR